MPIRIKLIRSTISSRAEAETAVGLIRELTIERNSIMLDREAGIKAVEERFRDRVTGLDAELNRNTELLGNWAAANQAEFGERKSIDMTHGTIGWRTGMPRLVKKCKDRWDAMIDKVSSKLGSAYVRTISEVDRAQIIEAHKRGVLSDIALRSASLAVEQDETFYVQPKIDEPENRQTA